MPDTRVYVAGNAVHLSKEREPVRDRPIFEAGKLSQTADPEREPKYVATSPNGTRLSIPKELFVALSDFMKTRKCPGSITIQFRRGEIICVEAVAKKTYRNS